MRAACLKDSPNTNFRKDLLLRCALGISHPPIPAKTHVHIVSQGSTICKSPKRNHLYLCLSDSQFTNLSKVLCIRCFSGIRRLQTAPMTNLYAVSRGIPHTINPSNFPDDFQTADGFARIIDKHSNHPSVIKIRENIHTQHYFYFTAVNDKDIDKLMQRMDPKKLKVTTIYLANCYVLGPQVFLLMYPN